MIWTDERIEVLMELWGSGMSASQVAERMGLGLTRNAIIGKVSRIRGYRRVDHPRTSTASAGERKAAKAKHRGNQIGGLASKVLHRVKNPPKVKPLPLPPPSPPTEWTPVRLLELRSGDCRYTVGEAVGAAQMFCGAPAAVGQSWCRWHHAIVYLPKREFMEKRFGALATAVAA